MRSRCPLHLGHGGEGNTSWHEIVLQNSRMTAMGLQVEDVGSKRARESTVNFNPSSASSSQRDADEDRPRRACNAGPTLCLHPSIPSQTRRLAPSSSTDSSHPRSLLSLPIWIGTASAAAAQAALFMRELIRSDVLHPI